MNRYLTTVVALAAAASASNSLSQTYFFVGPSGGSFFEAANWNTATDATGTSPDPLDLPDSTTGAIGLDLVIDATNVEAAGQVDFGAGSLEILSGAMLEITGAGNDIDFNSASALTLVDSTLIADGDVVLEGMISLTGGTVTALTDDVEIQDFAQFAIDGTVMSAGDNFFFETSTGTVANANITSADRLGIRAPGGVPADVVFVDSVIDINGGNGDVDNIFTDNVDSGGSVTLAGTTTLLADTVEEEVDLIIADFATATLGGNGSSILSGISTATLTSTTATLVVNEITNDPRASIINGLTGQSFLDNPSGFTVPSWNGADAVTLQIVPEPTSTLLLLTTLSALSRGRRRNR